MRIAGVVLAAGRSSRMAPRNKLLEPIGGEAMVRRVVSTALTSGAKPIIVVTGHEGAAVATALHGLQVSVVLNADYADGFSTSLRAGLWALSSGTDGVLVLLGDMPEIEGDVLRALMAASTGESAICVPVRHGRRGNPVLWGSRYFGEMMQLTGDSGAKPLLARYEPHLIEVEVSTDSIFHDVDAPEDLPGAAG